ncbi:MAG: non-canonical purine NTP pyrophosphatase [DPANN group archaeon]|nr:non-canonical purine NTP pyrophosphatase [DPANN group archaeon]
MTRDVMERTGQERHESDRKGKGEDKMKNRELLFITTNKHKVMQAKAVLAPFGIGVKGLKRPYDEASDDSIEEIAAKAAKQLADRLKRPVMVEDTGVFFDAYPGFPGAFPKFVFAGIGYDGLFRLLRGKDKRARFVSAVGFCRPREKAHVFRGEMKGRIQLRVTGAEKDVLPYERIFVPEGKRKPLVAFSTDEKLGFLHRTKAMKKLARFLTRPI